MAVDIQQLVSEGAARLVARSSESRHMRVEMIAPRVRATLDKYLLRHEPDAAPPTIAQFIDSLHADELLLVLACERGDEAAWNDLIEQYRTTVLSASRGACASESEAEDLAQSVWAELYGLRSREDGTPSGKLAYYSGCGSLGGWLRAVVGQLAIDRHRRSSRLVQTEEASDFDRLASDGQEQDNWRPHAAPDPERALAQTEATRAVQEALAQSVGELTDEDRLLVKLYYFDGLRLKEAGAVLGVHEATASRRLSRLHAEIRRRVESILVEKRRWTREETARTLAEVAHSQVETDMRAVLAAEVLSGEHREELLE